MATNNDYENHLKAKAKERLEAHALKILCSFISSQSIFSNDENMIDRSIQLAKQFIKQIEKEEA